MMMVANSHNDFPPAPPARSSPILGGANRKQAALLSYESLNSTRNVVNSTPSTFTSSLSSIILPFSSSTTGSANNNNTIPSKIPSCVQRAEQLLNELDDLLRPLKQQVRGLRDRLVAVSDSSTQASQTATALSQKKTVRLQAEMAKIMQAIDVLQTHKVNLQMQIHEAMDTHVAFEIPKSFLMNVRVEMQQVLTQSSEHDSIKNSKRKSNKDSKKEKTVDTSTDVAMILPLATTSETEWCVDKRKQRRR